MLDIDKFKKEYLEIKTQIANLDYSNWSEAKEILRQKKFLEKIINQYNTKEDIIEKISKNKKIFEQEQNEELLKLIKEEGEKLALELTKVEQILQTTINSLADDDIQSTKGTAIVEIRAGVGGQEANLFVKDLFQMYSQYCEKRNWKVVILNLNESEIGGYKEIIFEILNKESYQTFKNEIGVHRVQRIPMTEKHNRIHTSTVSVIVLPKVNSVEIEIQPEELRIDTFRSSGPGGQNVNKRETAVRVTHFPTGIVVACQVRRTQKENKEKALEILRSKILYLKKTEENAIKTKARQDQVKGADRSEKRRTYNFPQDRLTDHLLGKTWSNLKEIMNGNLDELLS